MCDSHDHDHDHAHGHACGVSRRQALMGVGATTLAGAAAIAAPAAAQEADPYAPPAEPALPPSDMVLQKGRVAVVVTDPQIDFLSPDGVTWKVVGESVTEHGVVENIGKLFRAAKEKDLVVAVSPHYYYPTDHGWKFEGPLEKLMHAIGMFDRKGPTNLDGFENSGADFMPEYREFINDGKTIVASPHKVYGPEQNDLALQLRKNGVDQVILAGMSANLCVEAHLRELLEMGFEVAVVSDATAAAKLPEGDGYLAAIINFRYIANALWTTEEAVAQIAAL
ncbi:cysteine hydrolase [Albidovulum sediminis]|uniref:Cysteine hydrolase n=1 Tax=Albidovulum sediminis TaxID=3066345 RepID=A0ABT2NK17_9RHOB|nr:cysteine hydrolase [Defluviimonas sediminis]MCT8329261.1 cysteine hydrolase [Defluviimonas sediminis]